MSLSNREIATRFERLADLLEIEGENPFRVRAYRNAAETASTLSERLADLVEREVDLTRYPYIGSEIAGKIAALVHTGRLPALDDVAGRVPLELAELMRVKGLGPKGVKALYEHFHIRSLAELQRIAEEGRVRELAGFGAKKEAALLDGIRRLQSAGEQRTRLDEAEVLGVPLRDWLAAAAGVDRVEITGSFRRRKETVGDLDILAGCADGGALMERLVAYADIEKVLSRGDTRSTVLLGGGLQVDVRAVESASYGAALLYFTGSKEHNVELRQRAVERGWKLNEYGLFDGDRRLAGETEEAVYQKLGMNWLPPEWREGRGEVAAAARGRPLPRLIEVDDVRGELHAHTDWSDGKATLEEMAAGAAARGLEYLAITDHGPKVRIANGLNAERLRRQADAIDALQPDLQGLTLLKGCEVDILEDGSLDLPEDVLARLDVVVCSIHYNLTLSRARQTERVLRAMDNPYFMIWGHPTAREINRRDPIAIELARCLEAAAERGIAVEINSQPRRLDLADHQARLALEKGCRLVVDTDAHRVTNLDLRRYGIDQARRARASREDIVNTFSLSELRRALRSP